MLFRSLNWIGTYWECYIGYWSGIHPLHLVYKGYRVYCLLGLVCVYHVRSCIYETAEGGRGRDSDLSAPLPYATDYKFVRTGTRTRRWGSSHGVRSRVWCRRLGSGRGRSSWWWRLRTADQLPVRGASRCRVDFHACKIFMTVFEEKELLKYCISLLWRMPK